MKIDNIEILIKIQKEKDDFFLKSVIDFEEKMEKINQNILQKEQEIQQKEQEIQFIKSSRFWKLRDTYMSFKKIFIK
jgi:hypothetical protein